MQQKSTLTRYFQALSLDRQYLDHEDVVMPSQSINYKKHTVINKLSVNHKTLSPYL